MSPNSSATGWGIFNEVLAYRNFDLSGYDVSGASLSGIWRVADYRFGVFLNGNLLSGTNTGLNVPGWHTDQAISAPSAFLTSGVNRLELRGQSLNSNWDGFYVDASVTGAVSVVATPEPATLALVGTGLLALGLVRRRTLA